MLGYVGPHVGCMLGRVGPMLSCILGRVGPMLSHVGPMLSLYWAYIEACWAMLGLCCPMLGPLGHVEPKFGNLVDFKPSSKTWKNTHDSRAKMLPSPPKLTAKPFWLFPTTCARKETPRHLGCGRIFAKRYIAKRTPIISPNFLELENTKHKLCHLVNL